VTARATALRQLMDEALDKLAGGEPGEAERCAKAVSALVRAERDLAEFEAAAADLMEDDDEARRAELRRRLALFAEADRAGRPPEVLERIALTGSAE
jgi:tRNA threonylcarbamoyladenosine modification (KEOPS) complex Cgi121 subunit